MQWGQWLVSVTGGVSVATIIGLARAAWVRRQVPKALSRAVARRSYLAEVLSISQRSDVQRLEAFVPNLVPAAGVKVLEEVQTAWKGINGRIGVQVITQESEDCLKAGAELLSNGIETRVARSLNTDDLSYHVFSGGGHHTVLNHKENGRDHPNRLNGFSPAKVFQTHFQDVWSTSVPLESVLAEQLLNGLRRAGDRAEISERFRDLRSKYALDAAAEEAVLRHVAFRHSSPVVFITGLPGAGKSLVRRRLAQKLTSLRFQVDQLNDYIYAYHDFMHAVMMLDEDCGQGFTAEHGGAFKVSREEDLRPALVSLAKRVWQNKGQTPITLVEFARTDVVHALKVFGAEVLENSQIIYVQASNEVRSTRLESRAQPPRIDVTAPGISITVSDDHRLPSVIAKSMYLADDFSRVRVHEGVANRVHAIDNEIDDPTHARVDEKLDGFIEDVIRPYKTLSSAN